MLGCAGFGMTDFWLGNVRAEGFRGSGVLVQPWGSGSGFRV